MVELDVKEEDGSVGFWAGGSEVVRLSGTTAHGDRSKIAALVAELVELRARVASSAETDTAAHHASLVAHDTNNALAAILCAAEAIVRRGDPEVAAVASQIADECTHAAELVRDLLPAASERPKASKRVDVNDAVTRLGPTLARLVSCAADVATELAPDVGWVSIGRVDLERVLVNLVTNARDASAKRIVVATTAVDGQLPFEARPIATRWIVVTVRDDGVGMDATTARAASEPFFTTKPHASSGLGLASVMRIASSAGGHLRLDTAPGEGTRVEVWLPSV